MKLITRYGVLGLLAIHFALIFVSICMEDVGAYNGSVLFHAGIMICIASLALSGAVFLTARSAMRYMAYWSGTSVALSWAAGILILMVSSTRHFHDVGATLSLIMLVVAILLQFVHVAVWYMYTRRESPDEPSVVRTPNRSSWRSWHPGHP